MTDHDDRSEPQIPFGCWLMTQRDRGDWVDGIADAARAGRTFPKNGDPEAVRAHLRKQQADVRATGVPRAWPASVDAAQSAVWGR